MTNQRGFSSIIAIGIIVLLVAIGGVVYFNAQPEGEKMVDMGEEMMDEGREIIQEGEAMMQEGEEMIEEGEKIIEENDSVMTEEKTSGNYEDYSSSKVANADGKTILFFHATWCPTCRGLDTDIRGNLESIPSDVTILKTDYDLQIDLRQKYGVTVQHTLVQVDNNGNLIAKWTGSSSLSSVLDKVQ